MPRATTKFLAEVRRSHTVYAYVDVVSPTQETRRLVAVDGSVTVDRTAQFRRSANIKAVDVDGTFVPDGNTGILTPFGTEVRPYRGVKYSDGTIEVYPLGVFRLSRVTAVESGSASGQAGIQFTLEMYDRSRTVSRDKFTTNYTVPQGTNVIAAIKIILGRTFPDLQYDTIATTLTTPAPMVFNASDDPWAACTTLAQSIGCEIYFNADGWLVVAPPTDIDALPSPDFTYIENQSCTMTDLQAVYADEPGFNGVIVTGASPSSEAAPVRAEAWDLEPSSPTYRLGPYGEVPQFVSNSTITTVAAAQAMADSLLRAQIGFASQLQISAWVNPAFEAGDVIQVERMAMHVTGLYTVDAFTVPLKKDGTQTVTLRQKRSVS